MWTIWNTIKNYTMNLWWITKILLSQNLPKHNCDEDKWYQCFLKLKYEYIQNNVSKIYPLSSTFFYLNEFLIFHWCQMNEETKRHQCLGFKKIVKEKEYINIDVWIYTYFQEGPNVAGRNFFIKNVSYIYMTAVIVSDCSMLMSQVDRTITRK